MNTPTLNHADYMKKVKTLSIEQLKYIIKDCQEAIEAMPNNPKNGWYADEVCYCGMELKRRETLKSK